MDTTTVTTVTIDWVKIIESSATEFTIYNNGKPGIYINYSSGSPASNEKGILLKEGTGWPSSYGTGEIWARVSSNVDGEVVTIL